MDCSRCGTPMECGVCPNCGFPVIRIAKVIRAVMGKSCPTVLLSCSKEKPS